MSPIIQHFFNQQTRVYEWEQRLVDSLPDWAVLRRPASRTLLAELSKYFEVPPPRMDDEPLKARASALYTSGIATIAHTGDYLHPIILCHEFGHHLERLYFSQDDHGPFFMRCYIATLKIMRLNGAPIRLFDEPKISLVSEADF